VLFRSDALTQAMTVEFEYPNWLSLSQNTPDTIAPGDSTIINVTLSSCSVNAGSYSEPILLLSNDPLNRKDTIPVSFIPSGCLTMGVIRYLLQILTIHWQRTW